MEIHRSASGRKGFSSQFAIKPGNPKKPNNFESMYLKMEASLAMVSSYSNSYQPLCLAAWLGVAFANIYHSGYHLTSLSYNIARVLIYFLCGTSYSVPVLLHYAK